MVLWNLTKNTVLLQLLQSKKFKMHYLIQTSTKKYLKITISHPRLRDRVLFPSLIQAMFLTKIKKYPAQWLSKKKILRNQHMMKQGKK
jgi:hypothetical protein